ncbi:unnamed protein product [Cyprideis torosa]|uniref:Uncharacterized protein n=1 Tax=Cyprideis torosa TaxID=163714 RepID=A0A7R8W896_9CRUS|nr:unnamed protein product [Cyprideis torosa]CAG0883245.1 unnamed protein product [Cyprideis torosa]
MAPGSTEPSGKPCPGKAKWNPLSVVMGGGGSWPVFYSSSCSPAGNVSGRLNRALNRFRRNRSLLPYHTGHPTNLMSLGFSQNTCKMGEAIRIGNSLILNVPEGNRIHDEDIQKLARDTNTQEKSAISVSRPEIPEDPDVRLPTPKEGRAGGMSDANPLEQLLSVVGVLTSSGRYYPSAPEYRPNVLEERSESSLSDAYFEECRSLERLLDPDQSEWWMESGCFGDRVANSDLEKSEDVNLTRHGSARNLSETESGFSHKPKSTVLVAKDQLSKTESTCLNADQQAKTRSSTSISAKKTVSSSRSKAVSNEKSGTSFKSKACTASKQGVSKDPSAPCQRESKSETDLEDKTSSLVTAQEKRAYFFVAESIADTECTGEIKEMRDSIRQGSLQTQRSGKSSRFDRQSSRLHRQEVPFKQVIDAESVWKNVHMISSSRTVHTQTEPWNQLTSKNSVTRSVHSRCRRPQTVFFSSGTENLEVQVKAPPPILCERCSSALNPLWRKQLSMCSRMSDASVCNSNSGQTEFSTKEATTVMLSCGGVQGLLNYILQPERNEKDERLSVQRERSEEGRLHIQPDRSEKEVRLSIQPKQSEKERLSSTQKRSEKDRLSSTQKRSEKDQLSSQQKQSEKERLGVQPKRSEKDRLSSTRKRSEKDQLSSQQKQSEKERLSVQPKRSEKDHLSNLPERSEKDSLSVKPQHSEKEVRMSVQTQCSHRDHEKFGSDAVSPTYRIPKEGGIQLLTDRGPVVLVEPPKLKRRGELTSKEFQSSHENRVQVSSRSISVHSLHSQSHTNKSRNESGLASPRNSEVETSAENTNAVSNMSKVKSGPDKIREIMPPKPVLTSMKSTQRSSRLLEAVGVARKRDEEAVAKAFDGQVEATSLFARGNVSSEEKDLEKGGSVHVDQDAAEIPETSDDLDDIGGEGSSETPAAESESSSDESLEYSASSSASSEESYVVSPETLDISKGNSGDQYADFNLRTFPDVPQSDRFNVSGVIRENNTKTPSDVIPETNTRSDVVLEPSSKASGDVDVFVESGKKSSKPRFPIRLPLRAAQELEAQNESALGVNSPESEGKRVEGNRGLTVKGIVPLLTMAYIPMSSPQKGNKGQKKSQVHALERTSNTTTVGTTMGELSKAKLKLMGDVDTKSLQIDLRETEGEVVSTQTSKMSKEAFRDPSMEEFVAREIARLVVETESQKSGNKALPDDVPDKMRSHLINLAKKENVGSDVIPTTFYARKENGGWKVVLEYTTDSNKNVKKYRKRFPDAKSIMAIEPGKEGEMPETSSRPVVAHVVKRNFLSAASSSASDEFQIVRKWQIYRRVGGRHPETDLVMYGRTGQQECVSLHSSITSCPMEEYYETLSEMDDFDKGVAKKKKVGVAVREPSLDVCRHPILGKLHPCCRPEMEGKTVVDVQNATEAFCILRRSLLFKKIDKLSPLFEVSDHKKLSFVVLADTHGQEDYLRYPIPPADVLLHAGDFSHHGTLAELKKFNDWIGRLPHRFKVVIAGNHDVALYDRDDLMPYDKCAPEKARASLTNCVYLEDSGCEILGVKIWGSPWTPTWGTRGFQVNRGLPIAEKWALIPAGTDLLMTHGPPVGHCDFAANNQYAGDVNLLYEVQNRVKPKIHVFGHIHEAYGLSTDGNTIYINAATCNRGLRPIRPAVYFELELPPGRSKNEVGWGKGGPDCFTSCTR